MKITKQQLIKLGIILIGCLLIVLEIWYLSSMDDDTYKMYQYKGIVQDKGKEEPTSGYKSSNDAVYYIILKEDREGKTMRINVKVPVYYDLEIGERATFNLTNREVFYSGNTDNMDFNLYVNNCEK